MAVKRMGNGKSAREGRRSVGAGVVALSGALALSVCLPAAAAAEPAGLPAECSRSGQEIVCTYTEVGDHVLTIPEDAVRMRLYAAGGVGGVSNFAGGSSKGGKGAVVSVPDSPVPAGGRLLVRVGGNADKNVAGFNGGGSGAVTSGESDYYSGGGGGASDVRTSEGSYFDGSYLIVAGGGGGGATGGNALWAVGTVGGNGDRPGEGVGGGKPGWHDPATGSIGGGAGGQAFTLVSGKQGQPGRGADALAVSGTGGGGSGAGGGGVMGGGSGAVGAYAKFGGGGGGSLGHLDDWSSDGGKVIVTFSVAVGAEPPSSPGADAATVGSVDLARFR